MKSLDEIFGRDLHHAYCLEGERENIFPKLCDFLEKRFKIKTKGNPDFWYGQFDSLSADEARNFREMQSVKGFSVSGQKFFIIAFNFATREAQNSLLKIFEEPTEDTHFFIITPSAEILLPTLKSRLAIISRQNFFGVEKKGQKNSGGLIPKFSAEEFLLSGMAKRLKIAKDIADEISDDKESKRSAIAFIEGIEKNLRQKISADKNSKDFVFVFSELEKCRGYLFDRSSSVKMILEHLSLVIPAL